LFNKLASKKYVFEARSPSCTATPVWATPLISSSVISSFSMTIRFAGSLNYLIVVKTISVGENKLTTLTLCWNTLTIATPATPSLVVYAATLCVVPFPSVFLTLLGG